MPVTFTFSSYSDLYSHASIVCDGVLRQGHERHNEVTKHPVEDGADVSDNIRSDPAVVMIEGIISSSPLPGAQNDTDPHRHITAFNLLTEAAKTRATITISTDLSTYHNMAIESFSTPREPRTGTDLYFTLTAREILFATTLTATVPKDAFGAKSSPPAAITSAQRRSPGTVSRGVKLPTPVAAGSTAAKQTARVKPLIVPKPQSWGLQLYHGLTHH